jgi:hypothetical protein
MAEDASALFKKLQIKPGMRIAVLHPPDGYDRRLRHLPAGVECATAARGTFDLIHTFTTERRAILAEAPKLARALKPAGILWVSYPKGKSLPTDLNRDVLRETLAELDLEAVANVAVDDLWSALRFKRSDAAQVEA